MYLIMHGAAARKPICCIMHAVAAGPSSSAFAGTVAPHRSAAINARPVVFITLTAMFLFC